MKKLVSSLSQLQRSKLENRQSVLHHSHNPTGLLIGIVSRFRVPSTGAENA